MLPILHHQNVGLVDDDNVHGGQEIVVATLLILDSEAQAQGRRNQDIT
jgi:hypothetical protein